MIDYRDVISMLFKKQWKDIMVEKAKAKYFLSITSGIDVENGFIEMVAFDGKRWIEFKHALWSPFILEAIMQSNGWKLVKREKSDRWNGFLEVYRK